ncbi:unnamed protein product [Boreogadus saida]
MNTRNCFKFLAVHISEELSWSLIFLKRGGLGHHQGPQPDCLSPTSAPAPTARKACRGSSWPGAAALSHSAAGLERQRPETLTSCNSVAPRGKSILVCPPRPVTPVTTPLLRPRLTPPPQALPRVGRRSAAPGGFRCLLKGTSSVDEDGGECCTYYSPPSSIAHLPSGFDPDNPPVTGPPPQPVAPGRQFCL